MTNNKQRGKDKIQYSVSTTQDLKHEKIQKERVKENYSVWKDWITGGRAPEMILYLQSFERRKQSNK